MLTLTGKLAEAQETQLCKEVYCYRCVHLRCIGGRHCAKGNKLGTECCKDFILQPSIRRNLS